MHRTFTLILAVLLIVALAIPAFATSFPDYSNRIDGYPHYFIADVFESNEQYTLLVRSTSEIFVDDVGYIWSDSSGVDYFWVKDGTWSKFGNSTPTAKSTFIIKNIILGTPPTLFSPPDETTECDGTSCPATDVNHDNICDDCGKVLTFNLRSTLLDFAKAQAETWSETWPYYAVVQESLDDRYYVYMANNPMTADEETGIVVTAPNGLIWFDVRENSDGTFKASGNYTTEEWAGELLYANHDIANFRTPPLAVIIQGVTGEALETTLPNLMNQVKTIVLSGVFCLALLICLVLLRRSLRTFGVG